MMEDRYELDRFVEAQAPKYVAAVAELKAGCKRGHWMWFVFPQLKGLGKSSTASKFGISGLDEARAYLAHPVLGPRLIECTQATNSIVGKTVETIFGFPDQLKFHSCMTLFHLARPEEPVFTVALDKYFYRELDQQTEHLLAEL